MLPDVQSYDMSFYIKQFLLYSLLLVAPSFANGGNLFVLLIKCVYKVLLRNKNDKYVYKVINNNFNLPTYENRLISLVKKQVKHIFLEKICFISQYNLHQWLYT